MLDTGENPEAPQPREMIDLEVSTKIVPITRSLFLIGFTEEFIFISLFLIMCGTRNIINKK